MQGARCRVQGVGCRVQGEGVGCEGVPVAENTRGLVGPEAEELLGVGDALRLHHQQPLDHLRIIVIRYEELLCAY